MTPVPFNSPKSSWRCCRFSLRLLLLFITICAIALGNYCIQQRRELRVAEIVKAHGGDVYYDHQVSPAGKYYPNATPPGPVWLRAILGESFFSDAQGVDITEISDEQLKAIAECDCLVSIKLIANKHAVNDLTPLANCRNLENVELHGQAWKDQHLLAFLSHPFGLKGLILQYTQITDEGLVALKAFPELESLWIEGSPVSGVSLDNLSSRCKSLALEGPLVDSIVLTHVKKLPHLEFLGLFFTSLNYFELEELAAQLPDGCVFDHPQ